jgi:hypothetical protein
MKYSLKIYALLTIILISITGISKAQEIQINIGTRVSLKSEILQENRTVLIHLPESYSDSDKSYPVLYRLDGNSEFLMETISAVNRISLGDEIAPEMIVVAIENTKRSKDMWPTNTKYNPKPEVAGATDFLEFIEQELIPYIESNYRCSDDKILCGQSLSAVFTLYTFLTKPQVFNSYIASSGSFPECANYFKELYGKAFQQPEKFEGRKIFVSNGIKDPLDPEGTQYREITDFTNTLKEKLGNKTGCKYVIYENEGHVPFHSLYDGLKFIYESDLKK